MAGSNHRHEVVVGFVAAGSTGGAVPVAAVDCSNHAAVVAAAVVAGVANIDEVVPVKVDSTDGAAPAAAVGYPNHVAAGSAAAAGSIAEAAAADSAAVAGSRF